MSIYKLKRAREHVSLWLDQSKRVASAVPDAQRVAEQLDWEVRTLESRPSEAANYSTAGIDQHCEDLLNRVTGAFPLLPTIDLGAITQVNSITTSTGSATVTYVMEIGRLGTPDATTYARTALGEYRALQEKQRRPEEIRGLVALKLPSLTGRFDAARAAYDGARAGQTEATGAAIASRNLVDGLKGELLDKGRAVAGHGVSLDEAVSRIFRSSATVTDVETEVHRRSALIADLSDVAKARRTVDVAELDGLWSRVLDHLLIVLTGLP
jgi:hypothetical protein